MIQDDASDVPLTSLQKQFWLLQRATPDSTAYHVCALFHVVGELDLDALRDALGDVVVQHAALHTSIVQVGGRLVGRPGKDVPPGFAVESDAVSTDADAIQAEFERPFDLSRGPLVRMRIWPAAEGGHLLAWTMHHVACDLATKELFTAKLAERYAARRRAHTVAATGPTGDYAELARWEQSYLESDAARRAEDYFAGHLGAGTSVLTLPEDLRRPARQSARGACVHFELPAALARQLQSLSRELATKPFLVLLTAYAALLGRHARQERVVIGVPFTNRRRPESATTFGCFVNNLPVAIDLSGMPTFAGQLRRVRATMLAHHRHQELPLERIVARIRPGRDPSRNALFQAGFTFEPPPTLDLEGARTRTIDAHAAGAQLDLFLTMWETPNATFRGRLEYCRDLFEPATAELTVRCYLRLLEAIVSAEHRETPVPRLPLLTDADRRFVVETLNDTDRRYDGPDTLVEAFRRQVARTPDALAVRFGSRSASYGELAGRADALARKLRAAGVAPGGRVGLFMERSLEMATAIWGVLLAGAAYVPIDPDFPAIRVAHVLEDATPTCILTHASVARRLMSPGVPVMVLDVDALDPAAEPLAVTVGPKDPAYIIFTSGSTGRPKGVVNTHRGIHNRIRWMDEAYGLRPGDLVLQKTPYTFDVSTWEFFWPAFAGAPLEVAPPGAHRDPAELAALIERVGVTTIHFVPSMLHAFLAHPAARRCTSLTRVVCSGEALSAALVQRCAQVLPASIYNLYGPTEAAVDVTEWRCREDLARDPVPIGKPIANTRLYILDPHGAPVARGVLGELYIGGTQVALGYVNRADLTAERFVPNPFSSDPDARLYRTGDLARWALDGNLLYEGRIDHQVKVRGNRIELGEIENVIEQHPAVLQGVVGVRQMGATDAQLVGYVVPKAGAAGSDALVTALRTFLSERLPAFMVPQHLVWLEKMPLTSSGKVDRERLPAPALTAGAGAPVCEASEASGSAVEAWLAARLGELLGGVQVGLQQNFFDLGATSLTCAHLMGMASERFGQDVPLTWFFEHPTVATLAARLATLGETGSPAAPAPDEQLERARERGARQRAAGARPRPGIKR